MNQSELILAALDANGRDLTEKELVDSTQLTPAAVANGIRNLVAEGRLAKEFDGHSVRWRKSLYAPGDIAA